MFTTSTSAAQRPPPSRRLRHHHHRARRARQQRRAWRRRRPMTAAASSAAMRRRRRRRMRRAAVAGSRGGGDGGAGGGDGAARRLRAGGGRRRRRGVGSPGRLPQSRSARSGEDAEADVGGRGNETDEVGELEARSGDEEERAHPRSREDVVGVGVRHALDEVKVLRADDREVGSANAISVHAHTHQPDRRGVQPDGDRPDVAAVTEQQRGGHRVQNAPWRLDAKPVAARAKIVTPPRSQRARQMGTKVTQTASMPAKPKHRDGRHQTRSSGSDGWPCTHAKTSSSRGRDFGRGKSAAAATVVAEERHGEPGLLVQLGLDDERVEFEVAVAEKTPLRRCQSSPVGASSCQPTCSRQSPREDGEQQDRDAQRPLEVASTCSVCCRTRPSVMNIKWNCAARATTDRRHHNSDDGRARRTRWGRAPPPA